VKLALDGGLKIVAMEAGLRPASTRLLSVSEAAGGRRLDEPNHISEWEQRFGAADAR